MTIKVLVTSCKILHLKILVVVRVFKFLVWKDLKLQQVLIQGFYNDFVLVLVC